jgi:low affinity Fe/Cu permease
MVVSATLNSLREWHGFCWKIISTVQFASLRGADLNRMRRPRVAKLFAKISNRIASFAGHYTAFVFALLIIVVWAATGPLFGFSNTWQLVINTGTTIVTFLMVFLIQNTQNREAMAVHLKLDELICSIAEADDDLLDAEDETDEELAKLKAKYHALRREHDELKGHIERLTDSAKENGRAAGATAR